MHFFSPSIRISGKSIIFDEKKVKRSNFYKDKKLFRIDDIDVDKILVLKKESYGTNKSFKYLIGYSENDDIKSLFIKPPIAILNTLNIIIKQCLSRLLIINY